MSVPFWRDTDKAVYWVLAAFASAVAGGVALSWLRKNDPLK